LRAGISVRFIFRKDAEQKMKQFDLSFPLSRPHCGLPMANGNLGILIWGDKTLNITINQSDFWDHRGGEKLVPGTEYKKMAEFARKQGFSNALNNLILQPGKEGDFFRPHRVPVGRFELNFKQDNKPLRVTLDYSCGEATVELSNRSSLKFIVSLRANVIFISDPDQQVAAVTCRPATDFRKAKAWLEESAFAPPERFVDGWRITPPSPEDSPLLVRCRKRDDLYVISTNEADDILEECRKLNRSFWRQFWSSIVDLHIPDQFYQRLFKFNAYKFACATHPSGYPAGLQGPWIEEYQKAQWSGDYHFNVNVQMIYGAALSLGCPQHLLPLFDMIEAEPFMETLRHNARVLFGIEDGLWFTHAVDDRGQQCGGLSCGSVLDPACGAWTALLYYEYWKYTQDKEFLRQRAFPFIRGIMRGYEEMLDADFNIPLAISAEYAASNLNGDCAGRNPSYQLAAMHRLAMVLLELSEELELEPESNWLEVRRRLPQYSLIKEFDAPSRGWNERIAIWEGQDLANCHRHHSHLAAIWPFDTLPELHEMDEKTAEIVNNSIDHWIAMGIGQWSEWCMMWALIIFTRMGMNEAVPVLLEIWRKHFLNEGLCTVYLPRFRGIIAHRRLDIEKPRDENEIMQLDGAFGYLSAMIESMAYLKDGTLYLFKGVPGQWKEKASFTNLTLPGGLRVDADAKTVSISGPKAGTIPVWREGKISLCEVIARR
jgi:alpha-L-fucosidase 2